MEQILYRLRGLPLCKYHHGGLYNMNYSRLELLEMQIRHT